MNAITDLLQHRDFRVRELGQKAVQYKRQLEHKEITVEEYATLREQLLGLEALHQAADTAEERQALAVALQFLSTFLQAVI